MTNYVQAAAAIRSRLEANAAAFGNLPITFGNDEFDPETDGGEKGWVYCKIGVLNGKQVSLGQAGHRDFRDWAQAHIWIYVPSNSLVGAVEGYAMAVRDLYLPEAFATQGFNITSATIGEGGPDGASGRWYGVPIIIAFNFDTLK